MLIHILLPAAYKNQIKSISQNEERLKNWFHWFKKIRKQSADQKKEKGTLKSLSPCSGSPIVINPQSFRCGQFSEMYTQSSLHFSGTTPDLPLNMNEWMNSITQNE